METNNSEMIAQQREQIKELGADITKNAKDLCLVGVVREGHSSIGHKGNLLNALQKGLDIADGVFQIGLASGSRVADEQKSFLVIHNSDFIYN